jgi:hypothetical protein
MKWNDISVIIPLVLAGLFAIAFVLVELFLAPEPVLAPFLLKQKIPVLIGLSNYLVALCNFTVMYFFPMWFQTVALTSAATAGEPSVVFIRIFALYLHMFSSEGLHLMPNSGKLAAMLTLKFITNINLTVSMSFGSMFAG